MQDKSEMFDKLPAKLKLKLKTAQNLSNRDLVNLAQTSTYTLAFPLALFKPLVDVRKLLHPFVRGKHDTVQSILTEGISVIFERDKVTDCSGRAINRNKTKSTQSKFEKFNELDPELKIKTAQNLSNRDLVNLAKTSKSHMTLFKPMIDVRKLLHHVTRGEHDAVKAMLQKDMSLIFQRGVVTDCSGREFANVSSFEYALWALDKHMWAAMIACIPQNEEGRKVFAQLIAQYKKVDKDGVTYTLNGKIINEKHFDFENTIIKELQTQVDSINAPGVNKNWEAINKQWREGVGGAQKLLPMHVVYEYCSDEPFDPVPKFTSQPPKSSKQFYNWLTRKHEDWFNGDSKLGSEFAIFRPPHCLTLPRSPRRLEESPCMPPGTKEAWGADDLDAMKALCKVRTNDFIDLKSQLEGQMTLDNHHQEYLQI